jgi:hypothetical protein
MCLVQTDNSGPSLLFVEGALTLLAGGLAFAFPSLGNTFFKSIERKLSAFARRRSLAVLSVAVALCALRLAILPRLPIPLPFSPDDFSFLLAADTFAHGRLTNPTPAMFVHFESIHIDMRPTYMSMYFPGQALVMAAGKLLFGQPWFGLLLASAAMCAAICWMLQGWFPLRWAFAGGIISVIHLGLFSYWTNTFSGGASVAAFGGALVLGAAKRWKKTASTGHALTMAAGAGLLVITRPYEGALLCLAVAVMLIQWTRKGELRFAIVALRAMPGALLLVCAIAWLGYYDLRVYGSPWTLPYTVNRATYAVAPYYVWQPPHPVPAYRHEEMRRFYMTHELEQYRKIHSATGFLPQTFIKLVSGILFFAGIAFLPLLFSLPRTLRDKRIRFLILCLAVLIAGMAIEIYFIPHYVAPFTAVIYAIGIQCLRHMCQWRSSGKSVGLALARNCVVVCLVAAGLRIFNRTLHMPIPEFPQSNWTDSWYGPDQYGSARAAIERELEKLPGKQLVLVRYSARHEAWDEWVYNHADIDDSKVIWARAMNTASDAELTSYYRDRTVWFVQPDSNPVSVTPYR